VKDEDLRKVDEKWMAEALAEAKKALEEDEVPIGCVIIHGTRVVGRGHNRVEGLKDPTAHAEIIAIGAAARALGSKWLNECTAYVNIEPCSMCAGALVLSRIDRLVYGVADPKAGACGSVVNIVDNGSLNHRVEVASGVLENESAAIVSNYFRKKRASEAGRN
jgi:tRNA(adenine34) deaminase